MATQNLRNACNFSNGNDWMNALFHTWRSFQFSVKIQNCKQSLNFPREREKHYWEFFRQMAGVKTDLAFLAGKTSRVSEAEAKCRLRRLLKRIKARLNLIEEEDGLRLKAQDFKGLR